LPWDNDERGLHARKLILKAAGYNVITASSGRIGLRLLQRHPVQVVILDYRTPDMNGGAVAREIRRTHPYIPILMLSGQIDVPKRASSAVDALVAKGQVRAGSGSTLAPPSGREHGIGKEGRWAVLIV
jgi:CheY-like chemotaxis protein